jgi:hypothetical protein
MLKDSNCSAIASSPGRRVAPAPLSPFIRTIGPTVIRAEVVQHLGQQVAPASEVIASHVWSDANGRVKVAYKKTGD